MAQSTPSSPHTEAAKKRLVHLGGVAARTRAAEQKILDAANDRRDQVTAQLAALAPRVHTDPAASDRYQELITERGRLDVIAAHSQKILSGG